MSCYIVNSETLNAIVNGMVKYGVVRDGEMTQMFNKLYNANARAYKERYPKEDVDVDLDISGDLEISDKYTDSDIVGSVNCYQYQVSDLTGFEKEEAYYKCNWLKDIILEKLVLKNDNVKSLPWGLE